MTGEHTLIEVIVISIVSAFLLGYAAKKLRLPTILGYLLAGVLIGPHTPGFVGDTQLSSQLAEIGVILLMFGVGLHFSPRDLYNIRHIALPGAVVQILTAIAMGAGLAMFRGFTLVEGIVFGIPLSVASTVVLLRALESQNMVRTQTGKIAVGWLVVEDIVMVLAIVLLPVLAGIVGNDSDVSFGVVMQDIGIVLLKIITFTVLMLVVGKRLLPGFLIKIVKTRSRELTSLAVLAIALGFAFAAYKFFDASFALGAFLAGMMLNESEIGAKVAEQSVPLKDTFAILFFVSVGMLFDPMVLVERPIMVTAALVIVVIGKSIAAYGITRFFRQTTQTCWMVSASLAQIGEFSFIFAAMARQLGLLPGYLFDVILACALISIAINPFLFKFANRVINKKSVYAALKTSV